MLDVAKYRLGECREQYAETERASSERVVVSDRRRPLVHYLFIEGGLRKSILHSPVHRDSKKGWASRKKIPACVNPYNNTLAHQLGVLFSLLIRLGTRQSPLARWQAEFVAAQLRELGVDVVMVPIVTAGDVSTTPLGESGGVGLFTKEIQRALLDRRCDLAVHSLKDLPTEPVVGLVLAAVPLREDVGDCLIGRTGNSLGELPSGAKIGTGSQRRAAQIRAMRPDVEIHDIRGNLDTRLKKLDDGLYDAILLAAAGLKRLGLDHRVTQRFTSDEMLPAVGQAALGLETRSDDCTTIDVVERMSHLPTHQAVIAERAMLRALRGGCLAPVAALATAEMGIVTSAPPIRQSSGDVDPKPIRQNRLTIRARVLAVDGTSRVETIVTGKMDLAVDVGLQAAKLLEIGGASRWIEAARRG